MVSRECASVDGGGGLFFQNSFAIPKILSDCFQLQDPGIFTFFKRHQYQT
jgi:hypothetical protein